VDKNTVFEGIRVNWLTDLPGQWTAKETPAKWNGPVTLRFLSGKPLLLRNQYFAVQHTPSWGSCWVYQRILFSVGP